MSSEIKSTTVQTNSLKDKTGTRTLASDSGSAWSWGSGLPSGSIVQVQSTQYTDNATTTISATETDYVVMSGTANATGTGLLDVNITPKIAGSKIWLQCDWTGEFSVEANIHNQMFFFWRNTTKLGRNGTTRIEGISPATRTYNTVDDQSTLENLSMQYIDTHGISAGTQITYKLGVVVGASSDTLLTNRTVGDTNTADYERGTSSLVAIEIAP